MHIAMITPGGAGMFCGSCMHDNTWARALQTRGVEVSLIPAYTPIRVDEEDVSSKQVFFGGINVYLQHRSRIWRALPSPLTRWLDSRWIIDLASRVAVSNDAQHLGALAVDMLQGELGPQQHSVDELVRFLTRELKPDIVCFSNALIVGALHNLRRHFSGKILCTLQGDDVFLEALTDEYRTQAIEIIRERAREFDGFLVHSEYYRDFMSDYLGIPQERFHLIPLGIDLEGHDGRPEAQRNPNFTVGFFARVCPEKGLHRLVDAFEILSQRNPQAKLRFGGYLGAESKRYFRDQISRARRMKIDMEYIGSPASRQEKIDFLKSIDVLSVPTDYHEPKGLYVLEAWANGVPVVQPNHGAFGEMISRTGGGMLVEPANAEALADALQTLNDSPDRRIELAQAGYEGVRQHYAANSMAEQSIAVFQKILGQTKSD